MESSVEATAPRRSTRLGTKKVAATADRVVGDATVDTVGEITDDEEVRRPTKRRKTVRAPRKAATKKASARKRGPGAKRILSKLPEMPLDILFEIFSHLHPLDLLHCARLNKAFRDILMRRSSRWIWIQAMKAIEDLPECPDDMSEPEFVNLIFNPHCHFCLNARVLGVLWRSRVRCCKKCVDTHLMDMLQVFTLLRPITDKFSWFGTYDVMVADEFKQKGVVLKSTVMELNEKLVALSVDEDQCKAFVEERKVAAKNVADHASLMEDWQCRQTDKRAMELERLRNSRLEAIKDRLHTLGYGPELDGLDTGTEDQFLEMPTVRQPKELTDRIWNNIKGPIIQLMEDVRRERVAQERYLPLIPHLIAVGKICAQFVTARPTNEFLPKIADFCVMPEIMGILHSTGSPSSTVLDDLRQKLPEMSERWRQECVRDLIALLPASFKEHQTDDADPSPLEIATAVFRCYVCRTSLRYPTILSHNCLTRGTCGGALDLSHTPKADVLNVVQAVFDEQPWRIQDGDEKLELDQPFSDTIAELATLCGKEPKTVTAREMDEVDARFVCIQEFCKQRLDVSTMTWRTVSQHERFHKCRVPSAWKRLDAKNVLNVKTVEGRHHSMDRVWSCEHCRDEPRGLRSVKEHIRTEHQNTEPVEGTHYYKHPSAEPGPARPVTMRRRERATLADEVQPDDMYMYELYDDDDDYFDLPFLWDDDYSDDWDSDDDDLFPIINGFFGF